MRSLLLIAVCIISFSANAQLTNGLVAHWTFNSNANDVSGNGHHGTPTNITYTTGKTGASNTAALFNGSSSFITVPNSTAWNVSNFTIIGMVKLNGFYTSLCQQSVIIQRGQGHTSGSWALNVFDNAFDSSCTVTGDTTKFVFMGEAGPYNITVPHAHWQYSPTTRTGKWYCVATTFDGSQLKVYVDGVNVSTAWAGSPLPIGSSSSQVAIGANRFGNYTQHPYWFNGAIDDLRLYNRVLAPTEIGSFCSLFDTAIAIEDDTARGALCPDDTFHLSYTVTHTFGSGNIFTAQLSDATGGFTNPQNIGSVTSSTGGTIVCTVPTGLIPGSGYRVRIVSSNPARISDLSSPFSISSVLNPSVTINVTPAGPVAINQYITFVATPVDAGASPMFQWYRNSMPIPAATNDSLYINTLNDGDTIYVVVMSSNPCPPDLTAQSNSIIVEITSSVNSLVLGNLNLYPNPNTGRFTISANDVAYSSILMEVIDPLGRVLTHREAMPSNGNFTEGIDMGQAANGIYILRLSAEGYERGIRFTVHR